MSRRDYFDDPDAPAPNALVPAVTGVIIDDVKILLIHRLDNGRWALPGGAIELGENVPAALAREVDEETGIIIEVTGIVGIYSDPTHVIAYDDGEVRQEFAICLKARPTGGQLRGSSEAREVAWVPTADLADLNMSSAQRLRIEHALDPAAAPHIG